MLLYLIVPLFRVLGQVRIEGLIGDNGVMDVLMLSWFNISMAYSSELSCGGTVNPLDNNNASSDVSLP